MILEPVHRRAFSEADRAAAQETIARAVETEPQRFIEQYCALEQSFNGRYISADLFKETFDLYRTSNEARNRYNTPVHNAAAVLAAKQFARALAEPAAPDRNLVVLLTGIPGAGKTSSVIDRGELPPYTHAVYEGQLAHPDVAVEKVRQVLDAGFKPVITVVHTPPEKALDNTLQRFHEIGRGASVNVMSTLQGGLPTGLKAVHERFGEAVELRVFDRRDFANPRELKGWEHLPILESEGNYEHIKQRLTQHLERHRERLSEDAWRQAAGLAPLSQDRRHDADAARQHEGPGDGREPSQKDSQETVLTARERFQKGLERGVQTPVPGHDAEPQTQKQMDRARTRDDDPDFSL